MEWGNGETKSWATWQSPAEHPLCCVCSVPTPGALLLQRKCEVQLPWQQHLAGAKHYSFS